MVNIIIAVIAIALIAILTIASLYHGGAAFQGNKVVAEAGRYRTEASQIASAVTLFKSDGNVIDENFKLSDLVDKKYLKQLPKGWVPGDNRIIRPLDESEEMAEEICVTAIEQSGYKFSGTDDDVEPYSKDPTKGIPYCNNPTLDPLVPCCINMDEAS